MGEGPDRFGAYCGCSDSREVWMSLASMLAVFSAAITLPIATLFASDASRAVLASVATPASTDAISGGTEMLASPVTEIADGKSVGVSASAGALARRAKAIAKDRFFISAAHKR